MSRGPPLRGRGKCESEFSAAGFECADIHVEIDARDEPVTVEIGGHVAGLKCPDIEVVVDAVEESVPIEIGGAGHGIVLEDADNVAVAV